jgi:glutamate 5-kinase
MLVKARQLVILTSVNGIYREQGDESTLIKEVTGKTPEELESNVMQAISYCKGASRLGANGAAAKLRYSLDPAKLGTHVYISSAANRVGDIISGKAPSTHIYLKS